MSALPKQCARVKKNPVLFLASLIREYAICCYLHFLIEVLLLQCTALKLVSLQFLEVRPWTSGVSSRKAAGCTAISGGVGCR